MTYTLEAGRRIVRDGVPLAVLVAAQYGDGAVSPTVLDALARDAVAALNAREATEPPAPFGPDDEHPIWTRNAWRAAIAGGCQAGYWQWVKAQPERPRVEVYEIDTGKGTGQFWPLDLGADQSVCVVLAKNAAAQLGLACGVRVIGAPDEVGPDEFAACKLAGYSVEKSEGLTIAGAERWDFLPPEADVWTGSFPTERAAWEACDRHRRFGGLDAPDAYAAEPEPDDWPPTPGRAGGFQYEPHACPTKHHNRGDDVCSDCGESLQ